MFLLIHRELGPHVQMVRTNRNMVYALFHTKQDVSRTNWPCKCVQAHINFMAGIRIFLCLLVYLWHFKVMLWGDSSNQCSPHELKLIIPQFQLHYVLSLRGIQEWPDWGFILWCLEVSELRGGWLCIGHVSRLGVVELLYSQSSRKTQEFLHPGKIKSEFIKSPFWNTPQLWACLYGQKKDLQCSGWLNCNNFKIYLLLQF